MRSKILNIAANRYYERFQAVNSNTANALRCLCIKIYLDRRGISLYIIYKNEIYLNIYKAEECVAAVATAIDDNMKTAVFLQMNNQASQGSS